MIKIRKWIVGANLISGLVFKLLWVQVIYTAFVDLNVQNTQTRKINFNIIERSIKLGRF